MIGELRILIKNNLAILMAQKQRRISELSKETGISRTTLTALNTDSSKMIQFKTINKLCQALGVTPNEFFEYEAD